MPKPDCANEHILLATVTLLRLLQWRFRAAEEHGWRLHRPWNPRKTRASVLDIERLLWAAQDGNAAPSAVLVGESEIAER